MTLSRQAKAAPGPGYKWIALSNTTLGTLMATINSSIVLIALPAIFNGIGINPLAPEETPYFIWLLLGYMIITATLVVSLGRISDMFGRVKLYNLGFAVFTVGSILLFITPGSGNMAAVEMIIFRLVQAVGASFLFANSTAILTDAFPIQQRGMALGINQISAVLGSIIGLILGGLLAAINWRMVFLVSVPFGVFGTIWAYLQLRETSQSGGKQHIDWAGNITFFLGLTILLIGATYGIEPYGNDPMGWTNPFVIVTMALGVLLLVAFIVIELRVPDPMFRLSLFKNRLFSYGNLSQFLSSLARGGLQFILIIWLQGIWLPLHGYSYEDTPLWAGIYMLPLMLGFIIMGPISGMLSDRFGARIFATVGMLLQVVGFILLTLLPPNFDYIWFALILVLMGVGQGLFASPNAAMIMNSVPANQRGAASGMRSTFMNAANVISMTMFFSIVTAGLSASLPDALSKGLMQNSIAAATAHQIAHLPPIAALFAAFLGYNPMQTLLTPSILHQLPAANQAELLGKSFFPNTIAGPFMFGLNIAFYVSAVACLIAALACLVKGKPGDLGADFENERESIALKEARHIAESLEDTLQPHQAGHSSEKPSGKAAR
ncbi:EmrB/QacA subfamily drug resistance transporter [Thermosporothrix hazakensis]|jgi:EmrB/QacA subfamily drug resistance transporter|uniref:EmrB/QacA subfamily drug resistance transporter n=1 Tax=Thermosporothrix hazakensis TaxID=644383 RepID=A0A326UHH6_THEHA|nr:MFS transporter [Thermosporothrix hazakensis]PZW27400.1 EmrB/QacA subfamily drug resistance transporter [Thermosporothrix hazakensis]GCE45567.1 MFS transporter [Thermosporothrix hazakensis]